MASSETQVVQCNKCLRHTNHRVCWEDSVPWSEEVDDFGVTISGSDTHSVVKCAGCGDVRLIYRHWFSEETNEDGSPVVHVEHYPPVVTRQQPRWRRKFLPFSTKVANEIVPLLDEVYSAHASGSFRLAVMGIRALTEKVMVDKVGNQGSFVSTVEKFFREGFVAPVQHELFRDVLIEAGHAAMHRDFSPTAEDVETLLDILESVIDTIYYQSSQAGRIGKRLPPDNRKRS